MSIFATILNTKALRRMLMHIFKDEITFIKYYFIET